MKTLLDPLVKIHLKTKQPQLSHSLARKEPSQFTLLFLIWQTLLGVAIKRGGVSASEADWHLLKQFCRGCWDDGLITYLCLAQKRDDPPPFAQLLLMLRTEEDKHAAKTMRMKQHLGSTKQRVRMHTQRTWTSVEPEQTTAPNVMSLATEAKELRKQRNSPLKLRPLRNLHH
ncbi:hypothetical protein QQF64_016586 [Cirrhinus molitorella]|uniref:Uncharacterized protein n=1 Tax=Cirrhinus molitorella TaxID=172907 RepID=A0ABR3LN83_9TELE